MKLDAHAVQLFPGTATLITIVGLAEKGSTEVVSSKSM
jgi:hypothetical protein